MSGTSYHRGGYPHHQNGTATVAAPQEYQPPGGPTLNVEFANWGANNIELFLTEKAKDLGAGNGWLIAAGTFVSVEVEINRYWVQSIGGPSAFRALFTCRSA